MKVKKLYLNINNNHMINKLSIDSKKVALNDIFYALKGENINANDYIEEAIYNGAKTIVYQGNINEKHKMINYINVINVRKQLARDAKVFYSDISKKIKLIGVTGTNGKTTTTTLLYKYLRYKNIGAALIGTNGIYINDKHYLSNNTTPSIIEIYEVIKKSIKEKINIVIMEVSSHAIKLNKINGLKFHTVLLTNVTQDHLDFHKTFDDYLYTKGMFLIKDNTNVIINNDIPDFDFLNNISTGNVSTFGKNSNEYKISDVNETVNDTSFMLTINNNIYFINTKMLAEFNVYNIVGMISILDKLKLFDKKVIGFLNNDISIPGRLDTLIDRERKIIIDFAHTPDGVEKILTFLNKVKKMNIITVIGCGGDRDKEKRPIIGEIVTRLSDFVIFTSDNPRTENPNTIINDITEGCETKNYSVVLERKEAIKVALDIARSGDIVAILGKGNEDYIKINNKIIHFNDLEEVKKIISENNINE